MSVHTSHAPAPQSVATVIREGSGADRAFYLLRTVFVIAPIVFGLDKFAEILTHWENYLAPWINSIFPGDAHAAMMTVGVVEIVAGVLVALRPRIGALVVSAWLLGIIVNLLTLGAYFDVALRDFGLFVAALALAALAFDRDGGHHSEQA